MSTPHTVLLPRRARERLAELNQEIPCGLQILLLEREKWTLRVHARCLHMCYACFVESSPVDYVRQESCIRPNYCPTQLVQTRKSPSTTQTMCFCSGTPQKVQTKCLVCCTPPDNGTMHSSQGSKNQRKKIEDKALIFLPEMCGDIPRLD